MAFTRVWRSKMIIKPSFSIKIYIKIPCQDDSHIPSNSLQMLRHCNRCRWRSSNSTHAGYIRVHCSALDLFRYKPFHYRYRSLDVMKHLLPNVSSCHNFTVHLSKNYGTFTYIFKSTLIFQLKKDTTRTNQKKQFLRFAPLSFIFT